jgi:hypothetical protein
MGRKFGLVTRPAACVPAQPATFDSLVKQGLEFHDKADKKRGDSPETACAFFREAIERYQVMFFDQVHESQRNMHLVEISGLHRAATFISK